MTGPLFITALLLAQAAQETPAPPEDVRGFVATITDEKGGAVSGLAAEDVAVVENGVARDLVSIEPDERPLTLALIIDTSEATRAALRLNVIQAASAFIKGLPEGSTFAVWSTGDRPTKIVDHTSDSVAAQKEIGRLFPRGGNTLLDAVPEAAADLNKKEGARSAVVVITGLGPDLSHRDRWRSLEEAEKKVGLFLGVSFEDGESDFEDRKNYDFVQGALAEQTGGRYETVLSPMALSGAVSKLLADLKSQYRLKYVTGPDVKDKDRKLEVKVARPGVKVRVGRSKAS